MSKPIPWGIIGLGGVGAVHYRTAVASDAFDVVAVCDPAATKRVSLGDDVKLYDDWHAMLDHDGLQAVSICTPHHLHGPMTLAALERGLHVLLEKPPAASLADAERIADAARASQCVVMMEMTHRFYPAMLAAKRAVDDGRVGKLYAVEDRIIEWNNGTFPPWISDRSKAGGGVALTNGIHMLDRVAFITGRALSLVGGVMGHTAGRGDIEDTATILLKLDDGTPIQLLAAWPAGRPGCDDELTLYGDKGTLRVKAWRGWQLDPVGETGVFQNIHPPEPGSEAHSRDAFIAVFAEFGDSIRSGRPPRPSVDDVLAAQRLIDAYYRACDVSSV